MKSKPTLPKPRLGWLPDVPDQRDHLYAAPVEWLAKLPAKVDLRPKCPPVYDQGQLGSCTANAIAGAVEFDQMKEKIKYFMPSRLFIYYNERAMEGTVNSDSGAQIRDGIKSVGKQGDCPETLWPYDIANFEDKPPASCYNNAVMHKAILYQRVSQIANQMKGCLASGYPRMLFCHCDEKKSLRLVRRPHRKTPPGQAGRASTAEEAAAQRDFEARKRVPGSSGWPSRTSSWRARRWRGWTICCLCWAAPSLTSKATSPWTVRPEQLRRSLDWGYWNRLDPSWGSASACGEGA